MNVETITVGPFEVNCYLVRGTTNEVLIIDPGAEAERIEDRLMRYHTRVAAYLLTHGHADHVSALAALLRLHPAPVYLHRADAAWAFTERNHIPPYYEAPIAPAADFRFVTDHSTFCEAGLTFRVMETPGHTPGGVCYWFPDLNALFSGDTLFQGSVGRTDVTGGSARMLSASLQKLMALPDATQVYAGHGPATTLAKEKISNAFLRGLR